jgi:hypothetical protein
VTWSRAVHHLSVLAEACADMGERLSHISDFQVRQLWTFGDVLESQQDILFVPVVLVVDMPPDEVAWWGEPEGGDRLGRPHADGQEPGPALVALGTRAGVEPPHRRAGAGLGQLRPRRPRRRQMYGFRRSPGLVIMRNPELCECVGHDAS